ncbi:MAG: 16S rRNA (cytidine(1402)-2'-O)-methyltransferase [bacterium]
MLHVVATPIGNLGDLTPRALEALRTADLIACEDTRRTWALLTAHHLPRPEMISYRQGNEERAGEQLVTAVRAGRSVVLCSDGGYPGISDPGYRLLRRAAQEGVPFDVLPGASAVDVALLLSGLPTSSYTFKGFPPRRPGVLRRFFADEREAQHTLVVFESPFRVGATLKAALEVLGDREAAVCVELTKQHERVARGFLSALVQQFVGKPIKGEVTLVIAGGNPKFARAGGEDPAEEDGAEEDGAEEDAETMEGRS